MAAIAHAYAEQTTVQTVSSATYTDVLSLASSNFTAGKKYLLLARADVRAATAANTHGVRLAHGGTAFADSELFRFAGSASWCSWGYCTVWTAVSSEAVAVQVRGSGTINGEADQITLFVMNLSDDLTENTDWYFTERSTDDGLSTTPVNGASVAFTPSGAYDWLVIAQQQVDAGDATTSSIMELNWSGATDPTAPQSRCEHSDASDRWVSQMSRVYALAASSQTLTEIGSASSGTAHTRLHSSVFALKLNMFRNWASAWTVADTNLSATDWATALQTLSITPAVTSDVVIGAYWGFDAANVARTAESRVQVDNSDAPGTQTSDNYQYFAKDSTDERPLQMTAMVTGMTAAAHTVDMDGSVSSTTSTPSGQHRALWAFTCELGSSNSSPTIAPNTTDGAFLDPQATLAYTASDADTDDVRYNLQITDNPDAWAAGSELEDTFPVTGGGLAVHPQHSGVTAWDGHPQLDDRPGQSFMGNGGVLDKVSFYAGNDQGNPSYPNGTAVVRVYQHAGVYGVSSSPLHPPVDENDTPTRGWLAESDAVTFSSSMSTSAQFYDFAFSGVQRIRLRDGVPYVAILAWRPADTNTQNTFSVAGDNLNSGNNHGGNGYNDGTNSNASLRGIQPVWDFYFRVYESYILRDVVSGTDAGFANTVNGGDTDPFTQAQMVSYTVPAALGLSVGATYRHRGRAKDPSGTDTYSAYTTPRVCTIGSPVTDPLALRPRPFAPGAAQ